METILISRVNQDAIMLLAQAGQYNTENHFPDEPGLSPGQALDEVAMGWRDERDGTPPEVIQRAHDTAAAYLDSNDEDLFAAIQGLLS